MPNYDFRCVTCGIVEKDVLCPSSEIRGRVCPAGNCGGRQALVPAFNMPQTTGIGGTVFERTLNTPVTKEARWI